MNKLSKNKEVQKYSVTDKMITMKFPISVLIQQIEDCKGLKIKNKKEMVEYLKNTIVGVAPLEDPNDGSSVFDRALEEIVVDAYENGEEWIQDKNETEEE